MIISDVSPAQERAINKLLKLRGRWSNAYSLQESRNTLDSLVRKGYAQRKTGLGAMFSPAVCIDYRAHPKLLKILSGG